MRQMRLFAGHALAVLLGMAVSYTDVAAQTGTLKEQVVGTWAYVSVDTVRPDGSRQPCTAPIRKGSRCSMEVVTIS